MVRVHVVWFVLAAAVLLGAAAAGLAAILRVVDAFSRGLAQ